jgi:hypothetical protein
MCLPGASQWRPVSAKLWRSPTPRLYASSPEQPDSLPQHLIKTNRYFNHLSVVPKFFVESSVFLIVVSLSCRSAGINCKVHATVCSLIDVCGCPGSRARHLSSCSSGPIAIIQLLHRSHDSVFTRTTSIDGGRSADCPSMHLEKVLFALRMKAGRLTKAGFSHSTAGIRMGDLRWTISWASKPRTWVSSVALRFCNGQEAAWRRRCIHLQI